MAGIVNVLLDDVSSLLEDDPRSDDMIYDILVGFIRSRRFELRWVTGAGTEHVAKIGTLDDFKEARRNFINRFNK